MENKPKNKIEVIEDLMRQTTEAVLAGEIALSYEASDPWKAGAMTVEAKAKDKMRVEQIKEKMEKNQHFLGFLERYKAKLEK